MAIPRERDVEKHLVKELMKIGLVCVKYVPDQLPGMPDRLVLLPGGRVLWVELKTDWGKLSAIQKYRHEWLRKQGHDVVTLWCNEDVDELIEELVPDGQIKSKE